MYYFATKLVLEFIILWLNQSIEQTNEQLVWFATNN
jgi:hypothetical protein